MSGFVPVRRRVWSLDRGGNDRCREVVCEIVGFVFGNVATSSGRMCSDVGLIRWGITAI